MNAGRSRLLLGLLAVLLTLAAVAGGSLAGLGAAARQPTPTALPPLPTPAVAPAAGQDVAAVGERPARTLLLTFAGGRADYLETYLADGTLRNLALLASGGTVTEYTQGVAPASPVVSHLSLASGSRPRLTGVVGERYRPAGRTVDQALNAASGPASAVPPIWEWERADGDSRVAVLFWPGGRGDAVAGADVALYLDDLAGPRLHSLELRQPADAPASLPASFSPPKMATTIIEAGGAASLATVWVALLDSRDDGSVAYDTLMIGLSDDARAAPATFQPAPAGGWALLALPGRPNAGVAFKLAAQEQRSNPLGSDVFSVKLYQSGVTALAGVAAGQMGDLIQQVGPPPPAPDLADLRAGLITLADYAALVDLRTQWQAGVIGFVNERLAPRMTLATLDGVELISRAVLNGKPANLYDASLRAAYRASDVALGRLLTDIDLSQSTVLIGSPHGYAGAATALNLSGLLASWLPADESRRLLAVYSSGGSAHIVFNVNGREPGGTLTPAEYGRLVPDLTRRLAEYRLGDRPAFERVVAADGLAALGLDHPNSGDIYVEAAAGVWLAESDPSGARRISWPAVASVAGYGPRRAEMRGLFVLAGRRAGRWGMIGALELVDLAPTLGELVGLRPLAGVEGRVLSELLP